MRFKACGTAGRVCIVLSLAVIILGVWSAVALAAPYATDQYPKASTSSTTPLIGAVISGSVGTPTVVMRLNGNVVPATLVGTTVSYVPTVPLANGSNNTVQLEMTDSTGTSTQSWSFTVNTAPTMTFTMTPTNGTSYTGTSWSTSWQSQGRMSVTSSSAGVAPGSQRMWLNGSPQAVSTTPSPLTWGLTNFQIWQTPYSYYREPVNGRYQLVVAWNDTNDVTRYGITQFTVNLTPGAQWPQPASGSTVLGPRPTIGAYVRGNAVTGNVRLTLDGNVVFDGPVSFPAPRGTYRQFSFTPAANLAPGPHTATIVVSTTSELGTVSSAPLTWSFTVQVPAAMSQLTTCETAGCHPTLRSAHPLGDCASCHGLPSLPAGVEGDHGDGTNCGDCHDGYHPGVVVIPGSVACVGCHGPQNAPYVFWHTEANTATAHQTPGCDGCHTTPSSLTTLHGQYPEGDPYKYQCDTCHASANAQVQAAITANDTSCDACHAGHEEAHAEVAVAPCTDCHGSDLTALHGDCATCHSIAYEGKTCVTCHPEIDMATHGAGPFYNGPYNANYAGYLQWAQAETWSADGSTSPHGNYATTTNKCAVCHAVHRAQANGTVLTAWDGSWAGTGEMKATSSCIFCHGPNATFTSVRVPVGGTPPNAYSLSPHGRCQRCHTASPHGAYASVYPVLKQKLINTSADAAIAHDLADPNINNMTSDMFDLSDPNKVAAGVTLGTGYLCTACHDNAANPVIFAVNKSEALPWVAGLNAQSPVTGHRVLAMNTSTWNEAGEYGAFYSGTAYFTGTPTVAGDSTIAFNPAQGCKACHDAKTAWDSFAFPHNYVSTGGAYATSSETSAALIWMTFAGDADDPKVVASQQLLSNVTPMSKSDALTSDGLCLKCHLSGDRTAGVGVTY